MTNKAPRITGELCFTLKYVFPNSGDKNRTQDKSRVRRYYRLLVPCEVLFQLFNFLQRKAENFRNLLYRKRTVFQQPF